MKKMEKLFLIEGLIFQGISISIFLHYKWIWYINSPFGSQQLLKTSIFIDFQSNTYILCYWMHFYIKIDVSSHITNASLLHKVKKVENGKQARLEVVHLHWESFKWFSFAFERKIDFVYLSFSGTPRKVIIII